MKFALAVLGALIALIPPMFALGDRFLPGLGCAAMVVALVAIASNLHDEEAVFIRRLFRPILITACIPAAWMYIQALPFRNLTWTHPIWQTAAATLNEPMFGSLGIDRGRDPFGIE